MNNSNVTAVGREQRRAQETLQDVTMQFIQADEEEAGIDSTRPLDLDEGDGFGVE